MNEFEKLKMRYHKIPNHYLIDELEKKFNQKEILDKILL
jgi:hypothetical protein